MSFVFGKASKASLAKCHPKLQEILIEAIKEIDFRVLDSTRNETDQNRAYATGRSKARFGQSAHNYVPAIAVDLFPAPYDWNDRKSFTRLSEVMLRIAKAKGIPLRWGGDWNMDGAKTTSDAWDMPHFELHKWRDWAKQSKLYRG
jgi:peptidoglycan L-alanyl-D-glutamate endopeptidase CwlK